MKLKTAVKAGLTGNPSAGGNWTLETDDIDLP
jgi:hypothetical protein